MGSLGGRVGVATALFQWEFVDTPSFRMPGKSDLRLLTCGLLVCEVVGEGEGPGPDVVQK